MTRPPAAREQLRALADLAGRCAETCAADVDELAARVVETLRRGGTLFFCGNGGSAADAQHLAAEYVVRFRRTRRALPALALTVDTSVLTAAANDHGFEDVFARQLQALARPGDLVFLHSTSGESENLLAAAETARRLEVTSVGFLARGGGRLGQRVDVAIVVPTDVTSRAQEMHLALGHVVCDLVDHAFAGEDGA
jgi:D-sedoheptulose 7-phosphate isomerase